MQATTITDNLIQLTRYRFVNAFLVREDDGFTLVDTTMSRTGRQLIAEARRAGAPITRIALTHGHGDHVGSVDELKATLGADVQVLMPDLDARVHAGEKVVSGKLTGSWPKLTDRARRPARARRSGREPRGDREPWPHSRTRLVSGHARSFADRRRCVHDDGDAERDRPLLLALSAGGDGHL